MSNIAMTPCKSSQVQSFGYDAATKTLQLAFNSGGIYQYHDVPAETFAAMQSCESVGKFLGAEIKNKFKFTRIPTPPTDEKQKREAA